MDHADDGAGAPHPAQARQEPDPQGQAAVLLVESLIHGLIAKAVLTAADAVEIIDIAIETKHEVAADIGERPAIMAASIALLDAMAGSLRRDADGASRSESTTS